MKKLFLSLILFFFTCCFLFSQEIPKCLNSVFNYTDKVDYFSKSKNNNALASSKKIIPVVFHIFHKGGPENISDAQILNQMTSLNQEFNRQMSDTNLTPVAFKSLASGLNIEFRLATIDPSGKCTNGINRIYTPMQTCGNPEKMKQMTMWPTNKYLNVWVSGSALLFNDPSQCASYYYSPFPSMTNLIHGVFIHNYVVGAIGTASFNASSKGRILVHEVGHFFNLRHIWGDTICGDDFVTDTPPAINMNTGCPSFPYNPNNSCGSNADGEMYCNYMDYTSGSCQNMFTIGQINRMYAALTSTIGARNNLWDSLNLISTGTNDSYSYPANCPAVPEVLPYGAIVICAGDSVQFIDSSYGGKITSRLWNFFGEPSSSLTDSIVKVKYNTPGIHNIALTINHASNLKSKIFTSKVYVLDNIVNTTYSVPFTESFENLNTFKNEWMVINEDNDTTWQRYTSTNYTGNACVGINNFNNLRPLKDELISPLYNLSSALTPTLSFRLHFSLQNGNNMDNLSLSKSTDCGKTWSIIYYKLAPSLKTVIPTYTVNHIPPPSSSEWRKESVILNGTWVTNPIRFKFTFNCGGGNNIFIDDINISSNSMILVNELFNPDELIIYPNPATNNVNVSFNLIKTSDVNFYITDFFGKTILSKDNLQLTEGENTIQLETSNLSAGMYILHIKNKDVLLSTKKIIVAK